jgi:hypothetical protein
MQNLVPIKFLPASRDRNRLLKVTQDTLKVDNSDFIERRAAAQIASGKSHVAIPLLAIENASEIAKTYLQAPGIFEQIMQDIIGDRKNVSYRIKTTKNNLTIRRQVGVPLQEFVLTDERFNNGAGHYGLIHLNHRTGKINVYDSMYAPGASVFERTASRWTNGNTWQPPSGRSIFGCKVKLVSYGNKFVKQPVQPTGGFVATNYTNFLNENWNGQGSNGYGIKIQREYGKTVAEGAYRLQQYDEMSQHHFCYMESIYAMTLAMGLTTNPGPNDPRERLGFIKKFIWGMIHKYTPRSKRNTPEWKYFSKTFPYIITTVSRTGKPLRLFRATTQLPDDDGSFRTRRTNFGWKGYDKIDPSWSITDVLNWVHTGKAPSGNRDTKRVRNNNNGVNAKRAKINAASPKSASPKSATPKSATPKSATPKSKTPPKTRRPTTRSMKPK